MTQMTLRMRRRDMRTLRRMSESEMLIICSTVVLIYIYYVIL